MNELTMNLTTRPVVQLSLTNCIDCPHHRVKEDPDFSDSFCSDDIKVVCSLANRNITVACRPYQKRKESDIPDWCPLIQKMISDRLKALTEENKKLKDLINSPEIEGFLRGVHLEAIYQIDHWGTVSDHAKDHPDWFWLVGYLAGKALNSAITGDPEKSMHHCISTAAALYNWHCKIKGIDVKMCPGRSDIAEFVESTLNGPLPIPNWGSPTNKET